MSKTIVFDFDGVIHKYRDGWKDGSIYDEPNQDVIDIMVRLVRDGYCVAIVSTRNPIQISEWWNDHNIPIYATPVLFDKTTFWDTKNYIGVFNRKIPAMVYIDDRGLTFDGNTADLYDKIVGFKTYQDKEEISVKENKLF